MNTIKSDKCLFLAGVITSPHGIYGEVKIKTFIENPEQISNFLDLIGQPNNTKFTIERLRIHKKDIIIASLKGINNRNDAEKVRGIELFANKSNLPPIVNKDEYYFSDLLDLRVENEKGILIGRVDRVFDFGAGNIIEIKQKNKKENIMLPFDKKFFPVVEINKRLVVSLPE